MRKMLLTLCLVGIMAGSAIAALYELKDLSTEEIQKLSDKDLTATYADMMVERKASEIFYGRAGFTPKEYDQYKALLKLIVRLREEMQNRGMTPPPIDEWLK